MKVNTLVNLKQLELLTINPILDQEIKQFYCGDLLSLVLKHARSPQTCLITTNTSINVLGVAVMLDFPVVIFTSDELPKIEVIEKANEENIILFTTKLDGLSIYREILTNESAL